MCANRSDRDAIVVSSLPAYPATLWQKRAKKRVNKNRFSFLTTHSHITYRIFSLSLSPIFSLCSLAIALTPPRYHFWFGSSLAYASTCLHYHCRLFFVVSVLSRSAQKQEVGIGSGRTSRSCALRRISTHCAAQDVGRIFQPSVCVCLCVCVFVWKCVHIR